MIGLATARATKESLDADAVPKVALLGVTFNEDLPCSEHIVTFGDHSLAAKVASYHAEGVPSSEQNFLTSSQHFKHAQVSK